MKSKPQANKWIIGFDDIILVTGAAGFIGNRVVRLLAKRGFKRIHCLVRHSSDLSSLKKVISEFPGCDIKLIRGNLLIPKDCEQAVESAKLVLHLVTGRGKSYPACFQNSVVVTRNLLDALVAERSLVRLVNVSSFAVYSNFDLPRGDLLDERCQEETHFSERGDAYVYAKRKQDDLIKDYHQKHGLPYVTVRPSVVFGPGRKGIPGVVGMDTFGFFMHLGGRITLPLTYVDNCADAIILSGLIRGIECDVFNVVDDDLPKSRQFLKRYKKEIKPLRTVRIPYPIFYLFSKCWEIYSRKSEGQLPPVFNRRFCAFHWKGHRYSNQHLKEKLGWFPAVSMSIALDNYFQFQKT